MEEAWKGGSIWSMRAGVDEHTFHVHTSDIWHLASQLVVQRRLTLLDPVAPQPFKVLAQVGRTIPGRTLDQRDVRLVDKCTHHAVRQEGQPLFLQRTEVLSELLHPLGPLQA